MKQMARRRFFVPEVRNNRAELNGDEAKHLTQVLRVEAGQIYEISDNERVYLAEVSLARKAQVVFEIKEIFAPPQPQLPLTLCASLIKFERLETIIEKATELGVSDIQFVQAERSEKGLEQAVPKRMARWQRIALEASQQSRRARLPRLSGPVHLRTALQLAADYRLFLDEQESADTRPMLSTLGQPGSTAILIGPEGGWPDHERESAIAAGWTPVSLGSFVLRADTAAIAALAIIHSAFQLNTR